MAKSQEKIQAQILRAQGESIKDIALKLNVSKGSVSLWCQKVKLTKSQEASLKEKQIKAGHKGRIIGATTNKNRRLREIADQKKIGKEVIASLSKRDLLLLGIGLYWGEGVKSRTGQTALVNSDSDVLICAKKWFQDCLGVTTEDFRPYIYISEHHKARASKILLYWSNELKIPKKQFHNVIFLKGRPKKIYKNHDSYYGILSLRVRKSTHLKYRIQGLIEACKQS